jgi:Trk K+ transport system NAD-binding subunit
LRYEELLQDARVQKEYDVIVVGLGRYGLAIARQFKDRGARVLGVDFDPEAIHSAQHHGITAIYGDASNPDLTDMLPVGKTRAVICGFPHYAAGPLMPDVRQIIAKGLRKRGYAGVLAVTSRNRSPKEEAELTGSGVDLVLNPFEEAAIRAAEEVQEALEERPGKEGA